MRTSLLILTICLLVACSTSKYTYYFDRKPTSIISNSPAPTAEGIIELTSPNFRILNQDTVAMASASKGFLPQENKRKVASPNMSSQNSITIINNIESRKGAANAAHEFKTQERTIKKVSYVPDKNKNGFAAVGFISSIVGLFIFWPLCVLGFILSAVGLKSERRGLAMAGFIIGLIGTIIIWVASSLT